MEKAIFYAFVCLAFTAINDLFFKVASNRSLADANATGARQSFSRGIFVMIIGVVEVVFLSIAAVVNHTTFSGTTIFWGIIAGFFSVISNILLIDSMLYQPVSVSSTIFRLNMILVVYLAHFLLDEPLTPMLVTGSILALLAILSFVPMRRGHQPMLRTHAAYVGFALAILACALRACMSVSYKYCFAHGANVDGVTLIGGVLWFLGGLVYARFRESGRIVPTRTEWKIGGISGVIVVGTVFFMARMNAYGKASVVNPIAQLSFVVTFLLSVLFFHEKPTMRKVAAALLGACAILFFTLAE